MRPNYSGAWKADLLKTRLFGPAPRKISVNIAHADPELSVEMVFVGQDGTEYRFDFKGRTTGEEVQNIVLGACWKSRLSWVDSELLIDSHVAQGSRDFHFRDFWSLTADGQTLTMEHRDDDIAGQITVLEKVAAVAA